MPRPEFSQQMLFLTMARSPISYMMPRPLRKHRQLSMVTPVFEPSNQMPGLSTLPSAMQPLMTVSLEKFFMPPACQPSLQRRRLLKRTSQSITRWPQL